MAKYKRRQTAWKVIAAAMIMLGVGTVLGITFDNELFPILMKGIIGCALAFAGMFMMLYLSDGLEEQHHNQR